MSATGLPIFDKTLHETNSWLRELMDQLHTDDRQAAYLVLRATLHALRDRIGPENAVHLGAQLPTLLRGVYYEGWKMTRPASRDRSEQEFLEHVYAQFPPQLILDGERAVRAVFEVLWKKIAEGEILKIVHLLPAELRDLWPWVAKES
ncbi:MAG TPA: DUF2267 domain-containing protein [Terriglobia bacterium]|nr:DUF2267 domain-containing protein [Terriglobia bacterium]